MINTIVLLLNRDQPQVDLIHFFICLGIREVLRVNLTLLLMGVLFWQSFCFKKYTISAITDGVACELTVFFGEEMNQFVGSEHFFVKIIFFNQFEV